ncbi:hypothetical protein PQQ64_29210 [Paraburkholderia graminis]|uniref:hypothetical protein n=1 Tax=Paraburkholderia graminis TaxID=60548 RepID=UPI0038BB4889
MLNVSRSSDGLPLAPSRFENIKVAVSIADNTREETPGLLSIAGTTAGAANANMLAPAPDSVFTSGPSNLLAELQDCIDALVILPASVSRSIRTRSLKHIWKRAGPSVAFALPTDGDLWLCVKCSRAAIRHLSALQRWAVSTELSAPPLAASKIASRLQRATGLFVAVAGDRTLRLAEISGCDCHP